MRGSPRGTPFVEGAVRSHDAAHLRHESHSCHSIAVRHSTRLAEHTPRGSPRAWSRKLSFIACMVGGSRIPLLGSEVWKRSQPNPSARWKG